MKIRRNGDKIMEFDEKELIEHLKKNFILNIWFLSGLKNRQVTIVKKEGNDVLFTHKEGYYYMLKAEKEEVAKRLLEPLKSCDLLFVNEPSLIEGIQKKYDLKEIERCYQAVYVPKYLREKKDGYSKKEMEEQLARFYLEGTDEQWQEEIKQLEKEGKHSLLIRPLDLEQKQIIFEHYDMLPEEVIEERLEKKKIYGGFLEEELVGFIGLHQEESMGMLEVFPEYRRRGYGEELELFMIKKQLSDGAIPYCQIDEHNKKSMHLQEKIGMKLSDTLSYCLF